MKKINKIKNSIRGRDPSYGTLFTFLAILSPVLFYLIKAHINLTFRDVGLNAIRTQFNSFLPTFTFALILYFAVYWIMLLLFVSIKLFYHGRPAQMPNWLKFVKKELLKFVFQGVYTFLGYNLLMLILVFILVFNFIVLPITYATYTAVLFGVFTLLFLLLVKFRIKVLRKTLKFITFVLIIPVSLTISFIVWNSFILLTSGFEVNLDQEQYYSNEDVLVKIYPYGLKKPIIREIFYSNNYGLLQNRTNDTFIFSPTYVIIDSSQLVLEPYNSFIAIRYKYGTGFLFFPDPPITEQTSSVPVFGIDINQTDIYSKINRSICDVDSHSKFCSLFLNFK